MSPELAFEDLACPACSTKNDRAVAGVRVFNPVGCTEIVLLIRCAGCGRPYLEVEEVGFFHDNNYWARGPLEETQAAAFQAQVESCPGSMNKYCKCPGHRWIDRFLYARWCSALDQTR